jgi:TetR/AcrR family transcriptional repressor of nem operon
MPRPSRKQDLLDAGIASVLNQGAAQTTVEAVCREIGATKGAFFHHFQGKDDFVSAMLQNFEDRGAQALAAADFSGEPTAQRHLQAYLRQLEAIYTLDPWFRRGCLFLIVAQEYEDASPVHRQCEQGLARWIEASTAEFRRIASRTGQPPAVDETLLAEQLLYTVEGALHVGLARNSKGSIHRALQQFERYASAALHIE